MGLTPIAGEDWVFEMTLNALLKPGSRGVPTWSSDKPGELAAIKLPEQFLKLAEEPRALNEAVGRSLATWAKGEAAPKRDEPSRDAERFRATETNPDADLGDEPDMFDGDTMVGRILAEVEGLDGPHAANDYERKNGRLIADLPEDDDRRVKDALRAKRGGRG